jgi:hypothetical protein
MFAPRTLTRPFGFDPSGRVVQKSSAFPQIILFVASLVLCRATDIEVQWSSDLVLLVLAGALLAAWAVLLAKPGDSIPRRRVAEGLAGDLVGTAALLGASLVMYRRWCAPHLTAPCGAGL